MAKFAKPKDQSFEETQKSDRPSDTLLQGMQEGSTTRDWSNTFHVDTVEGFVNGLFALHHDLFADFIKDVGTNCSIGETTLYQSGKPLQVRFEIKKIGYNEFQVRGAHFATHTGINICVGLNPQDSANQLNTSASSSQFSYSDQLQKNKDDFMAQGGEEMIKLADDLQSNAAVISAENFEDVKRKIKEFSDKLSKYLLY